MKGFSEYFNEKMETVPMDELRDTVQQPKLLKQLNYVLSNSTFYQKKFKNAGLELGDISTIHDLTKIPFTVKEEMRETQLKAPPLGEHMACSWDKVRRIYSSSGTSGRPTYIGVTNHDYDDVWMQISPRAYYCTGFRPGDRVVFTINIGPFVAGSVIDSLERVGCTTVPLAPGNTDRVITSFKLGSASASHVNDK